MNFLRGLSPFGPIFGKELRVAARRRRNYFLRVAYLGGLLLFLLFAWAITWSQHYGGTGVARRAQQQQQLGYYFFAFFSMFCAGAMALIGPVLTSTAINGERQAKTLHVLLMTPITAWQIVSGKLFSRMLTALTLIGLSLPVLALVRLLGGVELEQMFGVLCLSAVIALSAAALGLLLSILLRRAFAVIILAYLIGAIVYCFAPLLVASIIDRMPNVRAWTLLSSYNPFWCVGMLGWGQMRMLPLHWQTCAIVHLVATGVFLVASAILVRRMARHEGEGATAAPVEPPLASVVPAVEREVAVAPAVARAGPRRRERTVSDQPVLWRELRRPLMTRRWQRIAGAIVFVGLLIFAYVAAAVNNDLDDKGFHAFLSCCFYTLVMLVTCVIAATSIAQEKEGETWTVLLASPLSGWAIVWGKAVGVARRLMWPMVLVFAHFAVFTVIGTLTPIEMILGIGVMLSFNTIWIATGVALSLRLKKVTTAVIMNMALPVALYGVSAIILATFDALLDARGRIIGQVTWYLPFFYLIEGIGHNNGYRTTRELVGPDVRVELEVFVAIGLLIGLLHIAFAGAILAWTSHQFNRMVARAPQLDRLERSAPATNVSWAAAGR